MERKFEKLNLTPFPCNAWMDFYNNFRISTKKAKLR